MLQMNPQDWYWTVAGDETKVYSSKRNIYVDPSDADYVAWKEIAGNTGNLPDESEIWDYVKGFHPLWLWDGTYVSQPAAGQYRQSQLKNYNALVRYQKVDGGMVTQGIPVKTDDRSRNFIQGGHGLATDSPSFTTKWFGSDGNFYDVDDNKMQAMAKDVGDHTNACFTIFYETDQGIANGSVKTPEAIDARYSGV